MILALVLSLTVHDGLDEVNAARAARHLRAFRRDDGLSKAAGDAAEWRASHRCAGHTRNDFAFLPDGTTARAVGCGALEDSWGWATCCTYDRYAFAGAAWVRGRDGKRYMHLFVR